MLSVIYAKCVHHTSVSFVACFIVPSPLLLALHVIGVGSVHVLFGV